MGAEIKSAKNKVIEILKN